MSTDQSKKPRRADRQPTDESESSPAQRKSGPKYFLTVCNEGKNRRLYRGYPDPIGISFVHAGPWLWFLDPEIARDIGKANRVTQTLAKLKPGQVVGGGAAALVAILLLRLILGATDLDLLLFPLGFLVFATACASLVFGKTVHGITTRIAHLDSLSRAELIAEALDGDGNVRVAADTVSNVRIDPDHEASKAAGTSAVLLFRHSSAGKWRLILPSRLDTRAAARSFGRFLEEGEMQVNVPLKHA